ncbi:MAG: radical SAM protein [Ignavibacteriae bacterium]|nr:radical SAM protein [Ignavibacteriota bacterium]
MENKTQQAIRYGFQERLSEEFPSQLLVDVAEFCNLECIHCPHVDFKKSKHYSAAMLDVDLHNKLVEEVRNYGKGFTQYIRYASNGEPLIHPKIYEMLSYAVDNSSCEITLTTNGVLLDDEKIEKLLDTNIDVIDISLDAYTNETYEQIRVKGDLTVTRKNVLNLIKAKNARSGHTKIIISYVEMPQNFHETDEFEKYWKENGADYVIIRRMHSCSGANKNLAKIKREDNKLIERKPCLYPWERIVLNPKGHLDYCPSDWVYGSHIIDYRETTIYKVWHGEFYKKLRNAHITNDFSQHSFCGQCPDWESTRWPDEGRSYSDMMQEFKGSEE